MVEFFNNGFSPLGANIQDWSRSRISYDRFMYVNKKYPFFDLSVSHGPNDSLPLEYKILRKITEVYSSCTAVFENKFKVTPERLNLAPSITCNPADFDDKYIFIFGEWRYPSCTPYKLKFDRGKISFTEAEVIANKLIIRHSRRFVRQYSNLLNSVTQ